MGRFPGERLVRTRDDPDLGRLELWGWPRPRGLLDFGKPHEEYFEWRGVVGGVPFVVGVDFGVEPEAQLGFLDTVARATITSLAVREPALRRETAMREIRLARDWANNHSLSEEDFAECLRVSEIDVSTDANDTAIDLYFEDAANIFAGHVVTTSLDKSGNIIDTGIDG